jgi:hypothetical protein
MEAKHEVNEIKESSYEAIEYLYNRAEKLKNDYDSNSERDLYFDGEDPSEIKSELLDKIKIHKISIDQFLLIDKNNQSTKINFSGFYEDNEIKEVAKLLFKLCLFAQIRRYEITALKNLYCLDPLLGELSRTESIILQANFDLKMDSLLLTFFLESVVTSPKLLGIEFSVNGLIEIVPKGKAPFGFKEGVNAFFKKYSSANRVGPKSKEWIQKEFYLRYKDDFFVKNRDHLELIEVQSDLVVDDAAALDEEKPRIIEDKKNLIFLTYKIYKQVGIECRIEDLISHVETKIFPHNDSISIKYLIANGWFDRENYEKHAENKLFSKLVRSINMKDLLSYEDNDDDGESKIFYDFFIDQSDRIDSEGKSPLIKALELLNETICSESVDNELVERLKSNIFLILNYNNSNQLEAGNSNLVGLSYTAKFYECTEFLLVNGVINTYGLTSLKLQEDELQNLSLYNYLVLVENFFRLIEGGDLDLIGNFLNKNGLWILNGCGFYDFLKKATNNKGESPLYFAYLTKNPDLIAYLLKNGFSVREEEKKAVGRMINEASKQQKKELAIKINDSLKTPSYALSAFLLSKTRFVQDKHFAQYRMRGLYDGLCEIQLIIPIIEVIMYAPHSLHIIVNLESDSVEFICPDSTTTARGSAQYRTGRINIGGANGDEIVRGVIAHELTHRAMEILYRNQACPYSNRKENFRDRYVDIFNKIAKVFGRNGGLDEIIEKVFLPPYLGDTEVQHSELIVRVPHMLAQYGQNEGLKKLKIQAPELLEFYENIVLPACKKYVAARLQYPFIEQNGLYKEVEVLQDVAGVQRSSAELFASGPVAQSAATALFGYPGTIKSFQALSPIRAAALHNYHGTFLNQWRQQARTSAGEAAEEKAVKSSKNSQGCVVS